METKDIYTTCAERFRGIKVPTAAENISVIRTPFSIGEEFILLGKRHQGHLIALFPVVDGNLEINAVDHKLSNGFKISSLTLQDPETSKPIAFLELCNIGNIDETLFGALLDELLRSIDNGVSDLLFEIKNLLEKWKNMLSLDSERILSMNALVGLFGELLLLDFFVNEKKENLFDSWVGPLGNRHDFEFAHNSIEVKSTTLKDNNFIVIHGVHQLEAYPGKKVSILRVKLELDPEGTSLPELIARVATSPLISQDKMSEKLLKCGYKREQASSYKDIRFQPVEYHLIPVDENFPQITAKNLSDIDPKDRINQIEYSVNIAGLASKIGATISQLDLDNIYE